MGDPPGDTRRWEIHQGIPEKGRSSITRAYKKMGDLV